MAVKGPRDVLFYIGPKLGHFVCIVGKINNMMLCVKYHVNMCLRDVLTWKLLMNENYM